MKRSSLAYRYGTFIRGHRPREYTVIGFWLQTVWLTVVRAAVTVLLLIAGYAMLSAAVGSTSFWPVFSGLLVVITIMSAILIIFSAWLLVEDYLTKHGTRLKIEDDE